MKAFRENSPALTENFGAEEVMVGSLCGKAFFLNFQTGKPSRQALDLHNVVKGTMSLDPEMMNLYSGQGVNVLLQRPSCLAWMAGVRLVAYRGGWLPVLVWREWLVL